MATVPTRPSTSPFIAELHGLRGIALALVVAFHVFTDRVSGGIDIFLFLTGFLITRTMVGALDRGTFKVDAFLTRLAMRLMPLIALTVAGVAVATWLWMPQVRWDNVIGDLRASLLFYENWQLVGTNSVYGSADGGVSPVQHFWSLAVQGQFYLIWIVAVVGAVSVGRRLGLTTRTSALAVISTVVALSFAYATHLVNTDQPLAYLSTFARLWELGLGGILALTIASVSGDNAPPAGMRRVMGWSGLALVLTCGFVLDAANTFPGYQALWPLVGTAFVLVAGTTGYRFSADRLLRARALHHVGDVSFALYLWHWPVLVICVDLVAPHDLTVRQSIYVLAVSYALAYASTKLVSRIVDTRRTSPAVGMSERLRRMVVPAIVVLPVLAGLLVWQQHVRSLMEPEPVALSDPDYPGARVSPIATPTSVDVRPTPLEVADEQRLYVPHRCVTPPGTHGKRPSAVKTCGFGAPAHRATRTIALVGASHVGQWVAPYIEIAKANGWRVVVIQKNACQFMTRPKEADNACARWDRKALRAVRKIHPDLVVNLATSSFWGAEQTPDPFVERWEALHKLGIRVLAMRDTPRFPEYGAVCIDKHADEIETCSIDRDKSLQRVSPFLQRDDIPPNVTYVDFTDHFCNARTCPAVIGNVLVMGDNEHMTNLFSQTMRPHVAKAIASVPGFSTQLTAVEIQRSQAPPQLRTDRMRLAGPLLPARPGHFERSW
ncbi:acyltransferase [Nocardioidaceae bacterium SCSIO 66511]|nr:acyltransferase [Nocardioidaceae bacterium SCSIO 66511]